MNVVATRTRLAGGSVSSASVASSISATGSRIDSNVSPNVGGRNPIGIAIRGGIGGGLACTRPTA